MKIFASLLTRVASTWQRCIFIPAFALFTSISCAEPSPDSLNKDSEKYLSFYESVDDERIHWEVNFDGDKITSIYKNGEKIPDGLVDDYKEKVYEQLDEMKCGERHLSFRMPFPPGREWKFDMEDLEENLDDLKEKLKNHDWDFEEFYFDDEKLKQEMEGLREKLKKHKLHQFRWRFDDEKFRERMEEIEKYLKEHFDDLEFEFDCKEKDDEV